MTHHAENETPASGVATRSEAATTPLAGAAGEAPMANRGVNLVKGYLAKGGFDTLEVTLLGEVTSKWEREIRPWMFAQKTAAKERKLGELEWHCLKPEAHGDELHFVGQPFQVHATNGRPYGQLRTQFKLALGDASWLHLSAAPLKPGRWGIGRVELTEQFHNGCITDAIDSVKNLVNALGFDVTATAVTRADLAVNLPGAHVPELAQRVYDGVRGWLAKSTHKRVLGDPPGTIYVGDWQAGHYGFCIYHKISELKWLAKQGKITTEELCQRQQRFAAWGCPEEVTRVELRMKGMHLRKYEQARTVEGLAGQAADLYAIHATKGLTFTENSVDRANRNQARSKTHPIWRQVQETAQAVPWNLQNDQKVSHRVSRETQGMTAEKYIERAVRDLLRAVSLAEGEYESSLDVVAAMIACITPERIEGMDFREIMHAARQKFATPEQLRELGIPDELPTLDEWGDAQGARRVRNPNRLTRAIGMDARTKIADLLSGLPF